MTRSIILIAGLYYATTGIFLFMAPRAFYETTPGVAMMGPFNSHFIRDAGIAFLASGLGLAYGARRARSDVAIFTLGWPLGHAVFHIWIWLTRGMPFDTAALVNLTGIQLPGWITLLAIIRLIRKGFAHAHLAPQPLRQGVRETL